MHVPVRGATIRNRIVPRGRQDSLRLTVVPQEDKPASKLCHAGNGLARAADFLGDKAAVAQGVGLGILATSPVFPAAWEPGLDLLAAGGAVGGLAAVLQLSAGVAQSAGGGDGSANIGYASLIIVTGAAATRGIVGPTVSGYRTEPPRLSRRLHFLEKMEQREHRASFQQRFGSARCAWCSSSSMSIPRSGRRYSRLPRRSVVQRRRCASGWGAPSATAVCAAG